MAANSAAVAIYDLPSRRGRQRDSRFLHKPPALEDGDLSRSEREPFAVHPQVRESLVPIPLDARWVVGGDLVDQDESFGELNPQLVGAPHKIVRLPNL